MPVRPALCREAGLIEVEVEVERALESIGEGPQALHRQDRCQSQRIEGRLGR